MKQILLGILVFTVVLANAQEDELSGEIDKLDSGQIESPSEVNQDPTQSAEEIENELNEEFGISAPKKEEPVAPDEIPDEIVGTEEELPVVEETQSPSDQPVPVQVEEPVEDLEESFVEEPAIVPAPVVEEEPEDSLPAVVEEQAPPEPMVEEPSYQEPSQPVYTESVPDDFEEKMYNIYSRFYTEATSDTVWTQIAGEKINETYTVQPGDTLWDISVTFFGNGHYWPKVWQMNDNITNPHVVSPGYALKFVPGQINQAPQLNITSEETNVPGTTELANRIEDTTPAVPNVASAPVIPPPEKKYTPVLSELPPSLPYIRGVDSKGFDKDGFDIQNQKPKIRSPAVYLTSYLVEEKPFSVGEIVEMTEEGDETATLYETVFVKMVNGATVGEKLVVYGLGDKIKDSGGDTMGYPVIQQGEIQIQELVNPEDSVYKAVVTHSINGANVGNMLLRGTLAKGTIADNGALATSINAEIVGGTFDNKRENLGFQDIVYLNKGTDDGMKEGQIFTILKNVKERKSDSYVNDLKEQIAKIKVLKTTNARSTGIILESKAYLRSGDFIGTQAKLPKNSKAKEEAEEEISDEDSDIEQDFESE